MSSESNLPARCQDCARSLGAIMHRECNICQEMEFNEGIFVRFESGRAGSIQLHVPRLPAHTDTGRLFSILGRGRK
jgi:hypothetical protein